jgi:hypothetical protein
MFDRYEPLVPHLTTIAVLVAAACAAGLGACSDDDSTTSTSTSASTTTSSGTGGAGGGTTSSASMTTSVAIGGCYDAPNCGVPNDDTTTEGGCASCSIATGCDTEEAGCAADVACTDLRNCVAGCGMTSCIPDCITMHPAGADLYRDLLTCAYCACDLTSICDAEKAAADPPITCP